MMWIIGMSSARACPNTHCKVILKGATGPLMFSTYISEKKLLNVNLVGRSGSPKYNKQVSYRK